MQSSDELETLGLPRGTTLSTEQNQNSAYLWVLLKTLFQKSILLLKKYLASSVLGNAARDCESQIEHCGLYGVVGSL